MLVALTGGQKLGLAVVAGLFIAFALASAMLIPRRRPDFPGARGLKLFIAATVVLVIAMLTAIAVFARENEEGEERRSEGVAEAAQAGGTTGETTTQGESAPRGDPEAGAKVFAAQGCGGCHVLQDAGSSGRVGPNLDESKPSYELSVERVTNGSPPMPAFKDELSAQEIADVSAYVVEATRGS